MKLNKSEQAALEALRKVPQCDLVNVVKRIHGGGDATVRHGLNVKRALNALCMLGLVERFRGRAGDLYKLTKMGESHGNEKQGAGSGRGAEAPQGDVARGSCPPPPLDYDGGDDDRA